MSEVDQKKVALNLGTKLTNASINPQPSPPGFNSNSSSAIKKSDQVFAGMNEINELDSGLFGKDNDNVTMTIRVIGGKNIRGAKGEHVNSFVRVQFADFDYKDVRSI